MTKEDISLVYKYLPGFYDEEKKSEILSVHLLAAKFLQVSEGYTIVDINCAFNAIAMSEIKEKSVFRL